jgi:hypothetical protein
MPLTGTPMLSSIAASSCFDLVGNARGVLDPRAGRRAQMQADFAGIHRREEVAPGERHQRKRADAKQQKDRDEAARTRYRRAEHAAIAFTQPLEALLEAGLKADQARNRTVAGDRRVAARAHQIHREGRHQRAREKVRRDHREHHRFGERHEQIAGHAGEQEHRHEYDADRQRRDESRHGDFAGAVEDRVVQRLAVLQMMRDVFDGDRGVVDENPHGERKAAERHDVDGLAERGQRDQRRQHGERNRYRDD